jgi:TusA-related sulfurtransferase
MQNGGAGLTCRQRIDTMETNKEIDTRGLNCPLPILKAKKALADMASGQLLKVVATDGGLAARLSGVCQANGQ